MGQGTRDGGDGGLHYVSLGCLPKGRNQLANAEVWKVIDDALALREAAGELTVHALVALPDELLGILGFHEGEPPRAAMASFRSWVKARAGVRWQVEWVMSELPGEEAAAALVESMREAPLRAGLARHAAEWEFQR